MTPDNEPGIWQALVGVVAHVWPHIYAAVLAFVIALLRSLYSGGRWWRSLLEALLCGCLTLSVKPLLDYAGLPPNLAVAIGAGIAFLGVDWLRPRANLIWERLFARWLK